jgi:hypothetical protein
VFRLGYLGTVFDKIETWFQAAPRARRVLPFVSVGLLVVGLYLMGTSFGSSSVSTQRLLVPTVTEQLDRAVAAAQVFYADQVTPTFAGFNPKTAEGTDSSLTWNKSATATDGVVSIRVAQKNNVMLVSKDATGTYCISANSSGAVSKGKVDAHGPAECAGGW